MKKAKVMAIASNQQAAARLASGAAELGEETVLVYLGTDPTEVCADKAVCFPAHEFSLPAIVSTVVKYIEDENPDVVLTDVTRNGRYIAAQAAVSFKTAPITDAATIELTDGGVRVTRLVYGGKGIKTQLSRGRTVVCVNPSLFEAENTKPPIAPTAMAATADSRISIVSHRAKEVATVDIGAAKSVIGVGRGLKEESNLQYVDALAKLMNAEIACTRPVAEEMKWYHRERYIGVSGLTIKPAVYVAVGISGQIQHTIGVTGAGTILAINKDKDAPIFSQCDIGIVGDACEVLQALCAGLQAGD